VRRILLEMFRFGLFDKAQPGTWTADVQTPEHDAFTLKASEQGTVLLKNDGNLLPLPAADSIAVIGAPGGVKPKAEGGGSSGVIASFSISPLDGIRKRLGANGKVSYSDGADLAAAAKTAHAADVAIVFVETSDAEAMDRKDLTLPNHQDELINAVAAANPNTIVVLDTGGPVLMPWIKRVRGIVEAWYPGQEDGNAIAAVLYGDVNPAGKLPMTFPATENGVPAGTPERWPGVDGKSHYSEKLEVGYRWYDATGTEPLFPFGYGLSYTTFQLSNLGIAARPIPGPIELHVSVNVTVTNTGKRAGAEVVQVYVAQPLANGEPPRQLRGFAKVFLAPGRSKRVSIALDPRSFSIYSVDEHRWISPNGTYEILAGTSSRDLPLHGEITVKTNHPRL
jgi:beta-glucosidase